MTPNAFAWLTFAAWPVVVLAVYATRPRAALARTTAWMLLLPVMFLPAKLTFKTPGVPFLDKHRIAIVAVAVALELFHRTSLRSRLTAHGLARLVFLLLIWGSYHTVRTNGDALVYGPTLVPALTDHDFPSMVLGFFLDLYLPFTIGRRVFATPADVRQLFEVLSKCALIYTPLFLLEIRLSPQLHRWFYGYAQAEFSQHYRAGGFRPMVFMNHGLSVSTFLFTCLCASLALDRLRARLRPAPKVRSVVVGALVVLSKSLGATIYSAVAVLLRAFPSRRVLRALALAVVVWIVAYPSIRAANRLPVADVIAFFERISPQRADSLLFRFVQEEQLLAHARKRPVYGWGGWGRNLIYAPWGQNISVTDGQWIIMLGAHGYVGFAAFFALFVAPLVRFWRNRRRMAREAEVLIGTLALIVAIFVFDLVPNALSDRMPLVYAGALLGLAAGAWRAVVPRSGGGPDEALAPEPTVRARPVGAP